MDNAVVYFIVFGFGVMAGILLAFVLVGASHEKYENGMPD